MRHSLITKLLALALIGIGLAPVIMDGDLTILIFLVPIAFPLFFSKDSWVISEGGDDED